jgi:hypothetical protein
MCDRSAYLAHMAMEVDVATTRRVERGLRPATAMPVPAGVAAALEDAHRAGLLDGERTEHVSFQAPPALVEAAKRKTGIDSPTELGIVALAMLAQPDPVADFMRRTRGRLGKTHTLDD